LKRNTVVTFARWSLLCNYDSSWPLSHQVSTLVLLFAIQKLTSETAEYGKRVPINVISAIKTSAVDEGKMLRDVDLAKSFPIRVLHYIDSDDAMNLPVPPRMLSEVFVVPMCVNYFSFFPNQKLESRWRITRRM
jgi:hypothetical protein